MASQLIYADQASTLKEIGFPLVYEEIEYEEPWGGFNSYVSDKPILPTLELVAKWLREEKGLWIEISKGGYEKSAHCFLNDYIYENETSIKEFDSYEEALSAGIDKAIEILKKNGR